MMATNEAIGAKSNNNSTLRVQNGYFLTAFSL